MLNISERTVYSKDHDTFRETVRRFYQREVYPHLNRWEDEGLVDRDLWRKMGAAGLLCPTIPEAYGGLGLDFGYNAVVCEENGYADSPVPVALQSDINCDYIYHYGDEAQRQKWLPQMVSGEVVVAIAMTEPGAGSDLQGIKTTAVRDGDDYVINGSKTYITAGQIADLVIVVVKTNPSEGARGTSLILVEADRPGFSRGRKLDKIGQRGGDTSELFFDNVRAPVSNRLGEENKGFIYLVSQLPQERLSIAINAQSMAQRAFDEAVKFTKDRSAFGQKIFQFQNTRFVLAGLAAKLQVGWAHIDWALKRHMDKKLTTSEASSAKLFHTELQWEVCDAALQLHGGAGYMNEYPIARIWRDARVQRIYGGSSEIMKEMIGRSL